MRRDDRGEDGACRPAAWEIILAVATKCLPRERGHGWTTGDLASEVWLKMRRDRGVDWWSEGGVSSAATRTARRLIVDRVRFARRRRRGGTYRHAALPDDLVAPRQSDPALTLTLAQVLRELTQREPQAATCFELRYGEGRRDVEIAAALGRSPRTVERAIRTAREFLRRRLPREEFLEER